jgi:glutamate racemase
MDCRRRSGGGKNMSAAPRDAANALALGIFDSGVGGLTVFRQIADCLPNESIIYLGDTARVPYGTKSPDTVIRYARACAAILIERGIKLLVVACNTASAFALDTLRDELDIPVLGVVEPGAAAAVHATRNKRVGVIGTPGTISSGEYPAKITALEPGIEVFCRPCPLFVPLAEEGWVEGEVPRHAAEHYLDPLRQAGIDTLVLGCTHYPLLKNTIGGVMGPGIALVDSAEATARVVKNMISGLGLENDGAEPRRAFLVSDAPEAFETIGARFLGCSLRNIEWVDF